MGLPFAAEWAALRRPATAFAGESPALGPALGALLLRWVPAALADALLSLHGLLGAWEGFRIGGLPAWAVRLGADPEAWRDLAELLPPPPAFGRIWPWLLLAVPLGLLGTWLHHAVWDHAGLWLLGGLRGRGFRASLVAEAQALRVGVLGTLAGLLGFLPGMGLLLGPPLLLLGGYLWILRGFALAARHGCEPWRGVAATVLHAVLLGSFAAGFILALVLLVRGTP